MTVMRSGLVLFVSVTLVAEAIMLAFFFVSRRGDIDWSNAAATDLMPFLLMVAVTLPTCIALVILAWRGRRQPLSDGIALMTVCVLLITLALYIRNVTAPQQFADAMPMFIWLYVSLDLAFLVPAYTLCYIALRGTPLLRGLAPERAERDPRI